MRLVVIEVPGLPAGTNQPQVYDFEVEPERSLWVVGRQLGSNIHLVDPSVSRTHAEIIATPQGWQVRDLGSANGTFINDRPLPPQIPQPLRPGDRLRIGNVVTLMEDAPSAARPAPAPVQYNQPNPVYNQSEYRESPRNQLPPTENLYRAGPAQPVPNPAYENQIAPAQQPYYQAQPPAAPPPQYPVAQAPAQPGYQPYREAAPAPQPANYYAPPAQPAPRSNPAERSSLNIREPRRKRSLLPLWIGLAVLVLAAIAVGVYFLLFSGSNLPATTLPAGVFSSPANSETVIGLNVSRPSAWKRSDVGTNQVLFFQPDNPTTVLNLEKPPSHTITDPNLSPEATLKQYLANVKANASSSQLPATLNSVKLKDGTPAVLARLVFSSSGKEAVNDYTMIALSFKCGPQLYFVSAAAEAKNYNTSVQQDLDAAIANLSCIKTGN